MSKEEMFVRSAYERGFLYFSDHAYEKMRKHKISQGQVVKCRARVPFVTQESLFVNENLIL
jgi:hypothetical protein